MTAYFAVPASAVSVVPTPPSYDLHVDSVTGDDGNDGLTEQTALATLGAAQLQIQSGWIVGLARGSVWAESFVPVSGATYEAYGSGNKPTVDVSGLGGQTPALNGYPTVAQFTCRNMAFVGSGGRAAVYCYGATGAGGYLARLESCDISNHSALGLQSSFDGAAAGHTAELWLENCNISNCYHPTGATKHQAITAHETSKIYMDGGIIANCSIGFQNVATATSYARNVTISGIIDSLIVGGMSENCSITLDDCIVNMDSTGDFVSSSTGINPVQEILIKDSVITMTGSRTGYMSGVKLTLDNNDISVAASGSYRFQMITHPNDIVCAGNRWTISGTTSSSGLFYANSGHSSITFNGDTFTGIADQFIRLYTNATDVSFNYCVINGGADNLIWITAGFTGTVSINNCTVYGYSSKDFINNDMTAATGSLHVQNSIFHTVPDPIDGMMGVTLNNNIYYNSENEGGSGSMTSDPLLSNPGVDFHLQAGSPAINAGVDIGLTHDFDGNPISGLPDIGAFEA